MQPIILKEEKNFILLNKPAGLIVHDDGRTDEATLCDWLVQRYPEIVGVGESSKINVGGKEITIDRPGIVHRLDRDTSGVMIVARTATGFKYLKNLFKEHRVEKNYHAFVYGNIKEDELTIDAPISRSRKNFRQWFAGSLKKFARGKVRDAITNVTVLQRTPDKSATLIEACPKTGRTHQIRVHLKSIYHPIVADILYAPDRPKIFGFDRTALHSRSIRFQAPNGDNISVEAPYPEDFERATSLIKSLLK